MINYWKEGCIFLLNKDPIFKKYYNSNHSLKLNKNKFDFGFSSELMEKDLRYVLKQSANNSLDLKLTKNVHKRYKKLLTTKYRNQDTSSLIKSFLK